MIQRAGASSCDNHLHNNRTTLTPLQFGHGAAKCMVIKKLASLGIINIRKTKGRKAEQRPRYCKQSKRCTNYRCLRLRDETEGGASAARRFLQRAAEAQKLTC